MRIALTGNIACGKSAAAAEFSRLSWETISADALAHEVLTEPATLALVRNAFGDKILAPDGSISRRALGEIVFGNTAARRTLEAIIHPLVNARWRERTAAEPQKFWIVEIPLLFEAALETEFSTILCVHCTPTTQLTRLATRGHTDAECRARIASQLPIEEKVRRSTHAIFNEGSREFLAAQVRHLSDALRSFA